MEYAKEYTKKEVIIRLSLFASLGFVAIVANSYWFQPMVEDFGNRPHCYEFWGFNGADYVWHILFIGLPLSLFIIVGIAMFPLGIKGIKEGRFPPRSVKVYKRTAIKTGAIAYFKSVICILSPTVVLILSIWGYTQVSDMPPIDKQKLDYSLCQN
ncbi:hypothetical protein [Photobacterium angustum]|uniref:Uncharacterized protein n=1 Tax=Photobacterium angustum TaxID=661 RepID=A0A2S7VKU5_PHOAN|nr:hypothetical protein [Photobacterium angustum]PQJ62774.1 hypothetical protein BTO08_21405 [Photobacterium angustum]